MTFRPVHACVAALALLAGCSGISTEADWDSGYDFSGVSTYAWLEKAPEGRLDGVAEARFYEVADEVLASKGFHRVASGEADFLATYHTGLQSRQQYDSYGYGAGSWWGGYWNGRLTATTVRTYTEATLLIDIVDRARNQLVWRGSASRTLEDFAEPAERAETLRKAVERMLADFPPSW